MQEYPSPSLSNSGSPTPVITPSRLTVLDRYPKRPRIDDLHRQLPGAQGLTPLLVCLGALRPHPANRHGVLDPFLKSNQSIPICFVQPWEGSTDMVMQIQKPAAVQEVGFLLAVISGPCAPSTQAQAWAWGLCTEEGHRRKAHPQPRLAPAPHSQTERACSSAPYTPHLHPTPYPFTPSAYPCAPASAAQAHAGHADSGLQGIPVGGHPIQACNDAVQAATSI